MRTLVLLLLVARALALGLRKELAERSVLKAGPIFGLTAGGADLLPIASFIEGERRRSPAAPPLSRGTAGAFLPRRSPAALSIMPHANDEDHDPDDYMRQSLPPWARCECVEEGGENLLHIQVQPYEADGEFYLSEHALRSAYSDFLEVEARVFQPSERP